MTQGSDGQPDTLVDEEMERWREAWDQQERLDQSRQQLLSAQRKELLGVLMQLEEELRHIEGAAGWSGAFKSLDKLGWLHQSPPAQRVLLSYLDQCMLPMGKVGFFVGEGGIGKSWALTQLAIAVATGEPWLGQFSVPEESQGAVLMVMAEEDQDEMHRRL